MNIRSGEGSSAPRLAFAVYLFICSFSSTGLLNAAEDDYLKNLEAEARKIRNPEQLDEKTLDTTPIDSQRSAFESYLAVKHRGTYAFYRKLSDRSREEVFKAFVDGVSMSDIRHMVIDRRLNR